MLHAFQHDIPADEHFYERVNRAIGDEDPEGLVVHLVVKHGDGLRHIEVWRSKRDWDRFCYERLEPALEGVFAAAGFTHRPPEPAHQELEVVHVWTATPANVVQVTAAGPDKEAG